MHSFAIAALALAAFLITSCNQGPGPEEIDKLVEAKLEAMGVSAGTPKTTGSTTGGDKAPKPTQKTVVKTKKGDGNEEEQEEAPLEVKAPGLSDKSNKLATGSLLFIQQLNELMADYNPTLPEQIDNTDLLRCVTKDQRSQDADLQKLWKSLEKERKASGKQRKAAKREFYRRIFPVNFRIDANWKTRRGFTKEVVYGCWDSDDYQWTNYPRGSCTAGYEHWKRRSSRYVADESRYLYSNGPEPTQPELMKRIAAAGIKVPARFYCVVDNAHSKTKDKVTTYWVTCQSPWKKEPMLRVSGPVAGANRGDLVSVPFAGTTRPEALLLKIHRRWRKYFWAVDADAQFVKVEERTTACPESKEVATAVCRLAGKKSSPLAVVRHCSQAGDAAKLKTFATRWHKKLRKNKSEVMIAATGALAKLTPDDLWAHLNNGIYLAKAGRNPEALVSLRTAHEKAGDAKTQLQVAEYAKKAGDTALYTAAVKKACSLGMKAACGLVNG